MTDPMDVIIQLEKDAILRPKAYTPPPVVGWNLADKITKTHFDTLCWELRKLSIFFEHPISVKMSGWEAEVGSGYGGLSETFTSRGEDCLPDCGQCCENVKYSVLSWLPSENAHPMAHRVGLRVNGKPFQLFAWPFKSLERCEFLDPTSKMCLVHDTHRATMCHFGPQTGLYTLPKSDPPRLMLSRRIVSRNWRWPNCPIPVAEVPFTEKTHHENMHILRHFRDALYKINYDAFRQAVKLYDLLNEHPHANKGRILLPL